MEADTILEILTLTLWVWCRGLQCQCVKAAQTVNVILMVLRSFSVSL